jgi:hypothetical protein
MRTPYASLLFIVITAIAGCGAGGGGDGTSKERPTSLPAGAALLTGIRVSGTASEPVTATVNGLADTDAQVDAAFTVRFALDGGASTNSLVLDPGGSATVDLPFTIAVTDVAGLTGGKALEITLDP